VLLLLAGIFTVAFGAVLAHQGYTATRGTPYHSSNGRLLIGALIIGVGLALIIFGATVWLLLD
jgi:uncharacterized membrane protein YidH (DUF202 family)